MSRNKKNTLTIKEQRFIEYWDGNPTETARKAGYAAPHQRGYELIRRPKVKEKIQKREENERCVHVADRMRRQEFWTQVMEDEEKKMPDRLRASEYLARSEADFIERHQHTGKDGGPIEVSSDTEVATKLSSILEAVRQRMQNEDGSGDS